MAWSESMDVDSKQEEKNQLWHPSEEGSQYRLTYQLLSRIIISPLACGLISALHAVSNNCRSVTMSEKLYPPPLLTFA